MNPPTTNPSRRRSSRAESRPAKARTNSKVSSRRTNLHDAEPSVETLLAYTGENLNPADEEAGDPNFQFRELDRLFNDPAVIAWLETPAHLRPPTYLKRWQVGMLEMRLGDECLRRFTELAGDLGSDRESCVVEARRRLADER